MGSNLHVLLVIFIASLCTILTRIAPFLLFGGRRKLPSAIRYLGSVLPAAIMATLVVYCLKNVSFVNTSGWVPSLIGVLVTAGLHLWKGNTLLSIAGGTVIYMLLVQQVF